MGPIGVVSIVDVSAAPIAAPPTATATAAAPGRTRRDQRKKEQRQEPLSPGPTGNRCREQPADGLDDPIEDFGGRHHGESKDKMKPKLEMEMEMETVAAVLVGGSV